MVRPEPMPPVRLRVGIVNAWAVCATCQTLATGVDVDDVTRMARIHVASTGHEVTVTRALDVHYWRD